MCVTMPERQALFPTDISDSRFDDALAALAALARTRYRLDLLAVCRSVGHDDERRPYVRGGQILECRRCGTVQVIS